MQGAPCRGSEGKQPFAGRDGAKTCALVKKRAGAAKNEAIFDLPEYSGDLVGFRLPGYVAGVNAPGWHLHFVDAARQHGGHVVNFSLREGELRCCHADDLQIRLPAPEVLSGLDLSRDWSKELKRAEAER